MRIVEEHYGIVLLVLATVLSWVVGIILYLPSLGHSIYPARCFNRMLRDRLNKGNEV